MAFIVITLVLLTFTLAPLSRSGIWWIRGWDFPRMQLFVAMVVLVIVEFIFWDLSITHNLIIVCLGVVGALYLGWWILPYTRFYKKEVKEALELDPQNKIRIMVANVLITNKNADKLLALIDENDPDIMVTLETDVWWQKKLDVLEEEYPFTIKCPLENTYGMHVYSKYMLLDSKISFLIEADVPSMSARAELPSGEKILIYFLHPAPPSPTENETSNERDAELLLIAKEIKDMKEPVIVTGDMNDVAWSYTTRLFRKISKMLDPRVGRGMFSTFHAKYPLVRWPLDHLFHSSHFTVIQVKRLSYFHSDHFPFLIELELTKGAEKVQEGLKEKQEDQQVADEMIEKGKETIYN
ncbi:MAG TPA: endonuclease/exonuclease/phosphatase family protein [Prolixibacteraceae bacterium]|nr:endonuclease/exonuclease/phosphatase family protein [Prolixibacteraceae bacterium]